MGKGTRAETPAGSVAPLAVAAPREPTEEELALGLANAEQHDALAQAELVRLEAEFAALRQAWEQTERAVGRARRSAAHSAEALKTARMQYERRSQRYAPRGGGLPLPGLLQELPAGWALRLLTDVTLENRSGTRLFFDETDPVPTMSDLAKQWLSGRRTHLRLRAGTRANIRNVRVQHVVVLCDGAGVPRPRALRGGEAANLATVLRRIHPSAQHTLKISSVLPLDDPITVRTSILMRNESPLVTIYPKQSTLARLGELMMQYEGHYIATGNRTHDQLSPWREMILRGEGEYQPAD